MALKTHDPMQKEESPAWTLHTPATNSLASEKYAAEATSPCSQNPSLAKMIPDWTFHKVTKCCQSKQSFATAETGQCL